MHRNFKKKTYFTQIVFFAMGLKNLKIFITYLVNVMLLDYRIKRGIQIIEQIYDLKMTKTKLSNIIGDSYSYLSGLIVTTWPIIEPNLWIFGIFWLVVWKHSIGWKTHSRMLL